MLTASGYISVDELKQFNPHIDFTDYPVPTLSGMIHRCTGIIDAALNYTMPIEDIVNEKIHGVVNSEGDLSIWTQKFPIESISSLKIVKGTTSMTLALTSDGVPKYDIPSDNCPPALYPGLEFALSSVGVNLIPLRNETWFFLINYRAGWETIPEAIKEATSLLVTDTIAKRYNPGGFMSVKQGQIYYSFGGGGGMDSKSVGRSTLYLEAMRLVNQYMKVWA